MSNCCDNPKTNKTKDSGAGDSTEMSDCCCNPKTNKTEDSSEEVAQK